MTHLLGLTGSIGMGKSTTAQMFRDAGVPVWDADETVHSLYAKGGAAVSAISDIFPSAVKDGAVSREILKEIIADDLAALAQIEAAVHPLVANSRAHFMAEHDAKLLVFDIPLLFETKADVWLDSVLVVSAPKEVQEARVLARADMTEEQFRFILSRQMTDSEKQSRADHLIETMTKENALRDVHALIEKLQAQDDA